MEWHGAQGLIPATFMYYRLCVDPCLQMIRPSAVTSSCPKCQLHHVKATRDLHHYWYPRLISTLPQLEFRQPRPLGAIEMTSRMARSDEAAAFFHAVYSAVQEIPPGKVTSYGHIAKLVGTRRYHPFHPHQDPPIILFILPNHC